MRLNLSGMVGSSVLRRPLEQYPLTRIFALSRREPERVPGIGPLPSKAIVEPIVALTPLERAVARRLSECPAGAGSIAAATRLPGSCVERDLQALGAKGVAAVEGASQRRTQDAATRSG